MLLLSLRSENRCVLLPVWVTAKLGNFRAALSTTTVDVGEATPEFVAEEVGNLVKEEVPTDETSLGRLYDG